LSVDIESCAGRGVRIAVIDSGVHASHPHIGGVSGGVAFDADGHEHDDYTDRNGHGTAVAAAIRDLAPGAEIFAVKVFDRALSTRIGHLVTALDWASRSGMHVANLSLGTPRREHEPALRGAIDRATAAGTVIVSARDDEGVSYPRDRYRLVTIDDTVVVRASGLPRQIPGVPPERNLHGVSFAVANASAFVARALEGVAAPSVEIVLARLAERQA
jgi:subtilisin family serine protease